MTAFTFTATLSRVMHSWLGTSMVTVRRSIFTMRSTIGRFVPGTELSRAYWHRIVRPIVDDVLPGQRRAAALIGDGSDVLGFDTQRSTDHGWGPRAVVFLDDPADLGDERQRQLSAAI